MSVEPLPSGWKVVKSGSRAGMVSFINEHTKEKIGWYPTSEASKKAHNLPEETFFVPKEMLDDSNNLKLPHGWERVGSASRPGEFSYKNIYTKEKISWIPQYPAAKEKGKSADMWEDASEGAPSVSPSVFPSRSPSMSTSSIPLPPPTNADELRQLRDKERGHRHHQDSVERRARRERKRISKDAERKRSRGWFHRLTGTSAPAAAAHTLHYTRKLPIEKLGRQKIPLLRTISETKAYKGGRRKTRRKKRRKTRRRKRRRKTRRRKTRHRRKRHTNRRRR
jgi:hypothetical protein